MNYSTYNTETGKYTYVYDLEDCLNSIRARNKDNEDRIERLQEENKKLKEEHYKDNELSQLKSELETFKKNYYNGFPITEKERNKIEEWKNKHAEEAHGVVTLDDKLRRYGAVGGVYSYHFTPTSIGTVGKIKCSCGAEFTFQDL